MNKIQIAKIIKPFGVHGEMKIYSYTDFPDQRFANGQKLYLKSDNGQIAEFTVRSFKRLRDPLLSVSFFEINDMDSAEHYRNFYIYINEEEIPPLKEGEYFFRELYDCEVYQANKHIGKVIEVMPGIACNYLRIQTEDKKQHLVPFLPHFILSVDKLAKKIEILDLVGLL